MRRMTRHDYPPPLPELFCEAHGVGGTRRWQHDGLETPLDKERLHPAGGLAVEGHAACFYRGTDQPPEMILRMAVVLRLAERRNARKAAENEDFHLSIDDR